MASLLRSENSSWVFIEMFEEPTYIITKKLVLNEEKTRDINVSLR